MNKKKIGFIKENILGIVVYILILVMTIFELFIPQINRLNTLPVIKGEFSVVFPYDGKEVEFDDGWLNQVEAEQYRWVRKESNFCVKLSDQKSVKITGFIPEGCNASYVSLYLNSILLKKYEVGPGQAIVLEENIESALKKSRKNSFRIEFDAERVPTEADADQRTFSALFNTIEFR